MRTEQEIYAEFSGRDDLWPHCLCGRIAQDHPVIADGGPACNCYRPKRALTPLQQELVDVRKGLAVDPNQDLREQFHKILEQYLEGAIMEEEFFNAFIARLIEAGVVQVQR